MHEFSVLAAWPHAAFAPWLTFQSIELWQGHFKAKSASCVLQKADAIFKNLKPTNMHMKVQFDRIHKFLVCPQVGYQRTCAKFGVFSAIALLLGLISETLGVLCSGLFRSQLLGAIVLQGLYVPLLMFVGFFQVRPFEQ